MAIAAARFGLTGRELQVLVMLCDGDAQKIVADKLKISLSAVEKYAEKIRLRTSSPTCWAAYVKITR